MRVGSVAAVLAAFAVGCKASGPDLPVNPGGGGGGGGGGHVDAASGDGNGVRAWRVCLVVDARDLASCADTGAAGLAVSLGSSTATTEEDGSFTIDVPLGTNLVWHVSGGTIVPSVMPFGTAALIPVIDGDRYITLQSDNGVLLSADQGGVIVSVVRASAPLTDAVVTSVPAAQFATLYDGPSADTWTQSATGAHGTAWLPGLAAPSVELSVTPPGGSATSAGIVPVEAGAITFAVADTP